VLHVYSGGQGAGKMGWVSDLWLFRTNLHSSTSFPISDRLTTKEITKLSPISQSTFNVFLAHREIFVSQAI
jgi:hypothetical protein